MINKDKAELLEKIYSSAEEMRNLCMKLESNGEFVGRMIWHQLMDALETALLARPIGFKPSAFNNETITNEMAIEYIQNRNKK